MLVVVQHRDGQAPHQFRFDLETLRRRDVLELHRAERRCDGDDRLDDPGRVPRVDQDRVGRDPGQRGEQCGLALHHRQARDGPDVAETEDRGAVGDDRDRVRPVRVERGLRGVVADREADPRHAGRVDVAQDLLGRDLQRRLHVDLAALVPVEDAVGLADEARMRQRVDLAVELGIRLLVDLDRDFPQRAPLLAAHRLQVLDHELLLRDRFEHARERARLLEGLDQQDLGYLHAMAISFPGRIR